MSRCLTRHCLPALNHVASLLPITADRIKKLVILVKRKKSYSNSFKPWWNISAIAQYGILVIDDKLEILFFNIIIMLFSSLHLRLVDKSVVIQEDIAISGEMCHGKKVVTQKHHDNDDQNYTSILKRKCIVPCHICGNNILTQLITINHSHLLCCFSFPPVTGSYWLFNVCFYETNGKLLQCLVLVHISNSEQRPLAQWLVSFVWASNRCQHFQ